jgi:hypothetical protein
MKFTAVWDIMPWSLMEIMNLLEEKSSKMLVNFYQTMWCNALSSSPMTLKFDKRSSYVATCHIVGMANLYQYYRNIYLSFRSPHLRFPVLLFLNLSLRSSKLML